MNNTKIAVIGMSCKFPGADNLDEYWNNLILGKDTMRHFTNDELTKHDPDFIELSKNNDYVKVRGILNDIDKFDADFFGMTPKEAAFTDPQQRVWLETAWGAFENAGCDPVNYHGAIGVFTGGNISTYLVNNILTNPKMLEVYKRPSFSEGFQLWLGNDTSFISTKTAYKLNLRGPAINVQTACSTSLVAITQACQSLFSYESDLCLAGGVFIFVPQESGYIYQEGSIASPDGTCRPFDSSGKGTVFSNGVGAVILKRLDDAINDRDNIYGVVSGWALNNDGSNKVSYTAPSVDGQAEVIMMAQSFAEISPEQISYVEAHGTATQLGDPIEIAALKKAFSRGTDKKQFCGIGSVKSNIGHTDAAAGVASFIKTCLAAQNRLIPPSINFSEPNESLNIEDTPFYVQNEIRKIGHDEKLIMGVSSFGIGGTNAHVIVEEPPRNLNNYPASKVWPELLLLSAKSEYSLNKRKHDLIEYFKAHPVLNMQEVAYTLGAGRNHMSFRSFMVNPGLEEILSGKSNFSSSKQHSRFSKIAFMFPGQGAQYPQMGKDLYEGNDLFRKILDECFEIVKSETGQNLKSILFEVTKDENAYLTLSRTDLTQPALFIIEYALTKALEQISIKPDYMIGHSIGEYTAACIAGVFDMQTALKIVIKRGQLMQKMPTGSMFAVRESSERLRKLESKEFEIAAENAPNSCSISFKTEYKSQIEELLTNNGIKFIGLNTSHAFHSEAFDPIISEFSRYVNQFSLHTPKLPFISCLTGKYITESQATTGEYWASQLRSTVLFQKGVSTIARTEDVIYLEVGPETHLSSLARQNDDIKNKDSIVSTLGKFDNVDERYKISTSLGNLYSLGKNIDFDILMKDALPRKIALPTYGFERKRHWIDFEVIKKPEKPDASVKLFKGLFKSFKNKNNKDRSSSGDIINTDIPVGNLMVGTPTELSIYNIWCEAFMKKDISVTDNFFEIGGDSLLAVTIISKIRSAFNIDLPLNIFFESPIIKDLSEKVDAITGARNN